MNEARIVDLIKSGKKIADLHRNYGVPLWTIEKIKKKHNLEREYGGRVKDASKKAMLNGKLVYKSRHPAHFPTAKKENFSGAF